MILAISSEGTVRNGVITILLELMDILKGKMDAPHVSIWYYRLDDIKEVADPNMWLKAQPNLERRPHMRYIDEMLRELKINQLLVTIS